MKRNAKLFGIAALVAAMVLVMVACDTGTSPGGNSGGDPTVSAVTVAPASATVVKGGSQQFTASVAGTGSPAQTVTWSIDGVPLTTSSIDSTGKLTVASDEILGILTIRATSTVDTSKSGTATVRVSGSVPVPTVTGVTVSPSPSVTVLKGTSQQFTAAVQVDGVTDPAQTVTWSLLVYELGSLHADTTIDATGKLTVAAGETLNLFYVIATSTVDTSKIGSATVSTTSPRINQALPDNLKNTAWTWVSGNDDFDTDSSLSFGTTSMTARNYGNYTSINMSIQYSYENGEIKAMSSNESLCMSYAITENGTALELVGGRFGDSKWVKTN